MLYHKNIPILYGLPALILVDQQVGGGKPPSIQCPDCLNSMKRTQPLLATARTLDLPIIHLQEVHRRELIDFGRELDGQEGIHDVEGTAEAELFSLLQPLEGEFHMVKRRYSGFFATDLDLLLRTIGVQTVILTGQLTNVCVHYTAIDAHQYNYVVRVAEDCVAGSSPEAHQASLAAIEYHQYGAIRSSHELIKELSTRLPTPWRIPSHSTLLSSRWFMQPQNL